MRITIKNSRKDYEMVINEKIQNNELNENTEFKIQATFISDLSKLEPLNELLKELESLQKEMFKH